MQPDTHPTWRPPPGLGATRPPIAKKATGGIGQISAVAKGHNNDIWIFHRGELMLCHLTVQMCIIPAAVACPLQSFLLMCHAMPQKIVEMLLGKDESRAHIIFYNAFVDAAAAAVAAKHLCTCNNEQLGLILSMHFPQPLLARGFEEWPLGS